MFLFCMNVSCCMWTANYPLPYLPALDSDTRSQSQPFVFLFFIFYFICLFELEENQEQWNPLEHLILREDTAESFTKKFNLSDCESTFNYFHLFLLLSHSWMRINWCYILSKSFEIIVIHSKSNYCCFKCFSWLI